MVRVAVRIDLTDAEIEALEFEAQEGRVTVDELVTWMVRQNIPALLDVVETSDERRRQKLEASLIEKVSNEPQSQYAT